MIRSLLVVVLALGLPACLMYKTVGGYDVYGQVVDADSQAPLPGVKVSVRFEALSVYGNNSRIAASSETGEDGTYRIQVPETSLWGGTGGWSGYVSRWPGVRYQKAGYCEATRLSQNPDVSSYQDVVMPLSRVSGHCIGPQQQGPAQD